MSDSYISFAKTADAYRNCFRKLGVRIVDRLEDAAIVVLHGLIPDIARHYRANPHLRRKYVIAYAVWEANRLPESWRDIVSLPDEVWTPSTYSKEAFSKMRSDVHIVPHVVDQPKFDGNALESVKELIGYQADIFYFYTIGRIRDPRKGVPAAVRVLSSIVQPGKIHFIVKDHSRPANRRSAIVAPPATQIVSDMLDEQCIGALHHLCQSYVSAHCSEGWGLGMSEAMSCGNLVVATGFSGNMDFMTPHNSLPVAFSQNSGQSHRLESWQNREWANIDEQDLRDKLLFSHEHWDNLEPLRQRARLDMQRFSGDRIADLISQRLRLIEKRLVG